MDSSTLCGYTFHRSNIHERRRLATFARLFPLPLAAENAVGFTYFGPESMAFQPFSGLSRGLKEP